MPGDLFPDDGWGGESGPPGADGPGPAGQGAAGQGAAGQDAAPVPECFDAGFFPRGTAATPGDGPGPRRPGRFGPGAGFAAGDVLDTAMPGPALAGFADAAAGTGRAYADLNDDELIGTLVAWQKTEAWAAAGRLSAVAELIRRRPGADNAPPPASAGSGVTGGNGVSTAAGAAIPAGWGKFCADELAVTLSSSRRAAERMLALAHDLAARLPLTAAALAEGVIDAFKAQVIAEATRVLDDSAATVAEGLVVPHIAGKTPGQIRVLIGRAVLKADPDAARQRREEAQKDARVELWREDAGTAALCGYRLPPDEALAADHRIQARAVDLKAAGVQGTMDQLRVRAYLDILLGKEARADVTRHDPGADVARADRDSDPDCPAARATEGPGKPGKPTPRQSGGGPASPAAWINLTIPLATLLGLADNPGEAAGFGPLDADLARDLAAAAARNPSTSWCLTVTDPHGHPVAHGCARPANRARPKRTTRPGTRPPGGSARPPLAPEDEPPSRSTGPPSCRTGPPSCSTGPPGAYGIWRLHPTARGPDLAVNLEPIPLTDCDHRHETAAHDPSDRLRHLVNIRDGECTWPPCRRAAGRCDFEHAVPWEQGGRTCGCNAGPRCRHHHHQKQAAGWRLEQNQPGYHAWTTPAGRQYTSGPTTYPI